MEAEQRSIQGHAQTRAKRIYKTFGISWYPGRLALILFIVSVLACRLPEGARPTDLPPTATILTVASPIPTQTLQPTLELPLTTPTPLPVEHRISIRRTYGIASFYDHESGKDFIPRGVNYFYLVPVGGIYENRVFGVNEFDRQRVEKDFQRLREAGYNTVRIFLDLCNPGPECIVSAEGEGVNQAYLDSIVAVMQIAKENGLVLILSSNDLPEASSYEALSRQGASEKFASYRNIQFLTSKGIEAVSMYWEDLLGGLAQRQAPFEVVLGWELLNEQWYVADQPPFSLSEGKVTTANGLTYDLSDPTQKQNIAVDGMLYYIEQIRKAIQRYDPAALLTMGFFAPDHPNPWRTGDTRYVETAPLLPSADLDFYDFHIYPANTLTMTGYVENFGIANYYEKPMLIGETGAYLQAYPTLEMASRTIQDWIASSCSYGFDGWLYWGYYRASEDLPDATWGFSDGDGLMMKALSPAFQPDPCTTTVLRGDNLASGKTVRASASLPNRPPEAVLDDLPSGWNSGEDAPQWIEIDLGAEMAIGKIILTVDQWPDGDTLHQIWVGREGEELRQVGELRGWTSDGDILEFAPEQPLTGIRYVRILTVESPSWVGWVEIKVLAP
jgi:hypothetical protein